MRIMMLVITLLMLVGGLPANAQKRVALVIGNSAYKHVAELRNPRNDAAAVSLTLENLGFKVIKGTDLNRQQFVDKIREFSRAIRGADIALLFYAGHGLQVNGRNYLAPIETELLDETDLEFETVRLDVIMKQMEREPRTNLVFLDACRNNPLTRNLARSMGTRSAGIGRGLASIESGVGTLISFATQPGNIAFDGKGRNSPFTRALIKHLETPGEDIAVVLRRVRQEVIEFTDGKQVPWENSSLTGSVILKARPQGEEGGGSGQSVEIAYWNSIKNQMDKSYFEAYIQQFPNGIFANIAKLRIQKTEKRVASLGRQDTDTASSDPVGIKDMTRSIQKELNRVGCSVGRSDGIWGRGSRKGLKDFGKYATITMASLDPSPELLDALKKQDGRVCPLVCGSDQKMRNGKCVSIRTDRSGDKKKKTARAGGGCPANATKASYRLMPYNGLKRRSSSNLRHPCGKTMMCIPGGGNSRDCWWVK